MLRKNSSVKCKKKEKKIMGNSKATRKAPTKKNA